MKLKSLRKTLGTLRLQMLLELHRSHLELQSWRRSAPCMPTRQMSLPSLWRTQGTQRLQMPMGLHKSHLGLQTWLWRVLCT